MSALFTKLPNPPQNIAKASIISINKNEFIAVPPAKKKKIWGIYKYSTLTNSWMQFIKYPPNFKCTCHAVTFNPQNQILYISDSKKKKLIAVDINSHKFESFPYPSGLLNPSFDPDWPCLLTVNDTVHLIGGNHSRDHYEWSINDKIWTKIHSFETHGIRTAFSIFIPTKQLILLVGGWSSGQPRTYIHTYSLLDKTWYEKFKLWPTCSIIHHGMVLVSSLNECNVIILGSKPSELKYPDKSSTFILNINDDNKLKIIESEICCPVNLRNGQAVITGDKNEVLVEGYIKQLMNIIDPPISIIELIAEWCDRKMIHWLGFSNNVNFHWNVRVDSILSR